MKSNLLLVLVMAFLCSYANAQLRTVTDYFLAIPLDQYSTDSSGKKVTSRAKLEKLRRSMIKIEDIPNGYLRIEGSWEGWAEIALFKKKDGSYIVGQAENGCGPACAGWIKFWSVDKGKWKDITSTVFKDISDVEAAAAFNSIKPSEEESAEAAGFPFYFLLPRKGTDLKVACNECTQSGPEDFVFAEYSWNGSIFNRK